MDTIPVMILIMKNRDGIIERFAGQLEFNKRVLTVESYNRLIFGPNRLFTITFVQMIGQGQNGAIEMDS